MTTAVPSHLTKFHWEPQPAAQRLVDELIAQFLAANPAASTLAQRMTAETGTRFKDWIDAIFVPASSGVEPRLKEVGYVQKPQPGADRCFVNDLGIFPAIVLVEGGVTRIAIKVDSVAEFLATHQINPSTPIEGEPLSQYRTAKAFPGSNAELWATERHGYRGFAALAPNPGKGIAAQQHLENLCRRGRDFATDAEGFAEVNRLVDAAIKDLGRDWTCDLFFEAERRYWMRRNRAAQVQYARQQKLGLGWANHDHHTYRCGRENFPALVALWKKLGFNCREAFYAGAEAGWGAQVMEQPVTNITTFNDVDMSPEELLKDFAHLGFTEKRDQLGTVGLWCGLHGEAVLQAGMHHLECQFDWHALVEQLEKQGGVKTMAPFTTFPYLRQAFTEGERWAVRAERVQTLLDKGFITAEQAEKFRKEGALGSHLENLERNDGFKGFNQQGVSDIIARTDPRKIAAMSA